MDRLKMMESFVTVAKAKSFSTAAEQLGVSRAIVTKHIIELEGRLGARLLNRTTRRVALTEIGVEYYDFCTSILGELERRESAIARLQKEPRGAIKVVAPNSFGALHFSTAVANFALKYPQIQISLILDNSSTQTFDFANNEFDIAIRLSPIPETSSAIARQIGTLRWVLCAAPAYLERHGEPKALADLSQRNCLIHLKLAPDRIWRFDGARRKSSVKVGGTFYSNSILAVRGAALAGLGIAMLPTYYIGEDLRQGALRRVLQSVPSVERPVYALFPDRRMIPTKVKLFADFLADWYKRRSWDQAAA